jgi:hypothetical protein
MRVMSKESGRGRCATVTNCETSPFECVTQARLFETQPAVSLDSFHYSFGSHQNRFFHGLMSEGARPFEKVAVHNILTLVFLFQNFGS